MSDLIVDEERGRAGSKYHQFTGICVRAKMRGNSMGLVPDKWGSFDIATLTLASLRDWLRSRGGENRWAENTVALLLEHSQQEFVRVWGGQ